MRSGLRIVQAGSLPQGVDYVHMEDPEHLGAVLAERARRALTWGGND